MQIKSISPTEVYQLQQESGAIVIIDVRERDEFEEISSPLASNVALSEFDVKVATRNGDKKTSIFVLCRSGRRSRRAAEILASAGFESVYNIEGGMIEWEASGLPVRR
jgi:phage shock protein E